MFLVNDVLLTSGVSLLSSLMGASIAFVAQNRMLSRQLKHDKEKSEELLRLEQEKEDKRKTLEQIKLANEILRLDGEYQITKDSKQGYYDFEDELYFKHIRPLIYASFHLFDKDTRRLIREIDVYTSIMRREEEKDLELLELTTKNYLLMLNRMVITSEYYPDKESLPQ